MKHKRIFVISFIFLALLGCQSKINRGIPDELVGVWETSEPRYKDRSFEITKDSLIIQEGEGDFEFKEYPISNVEETTEAGETIYTIFYRSPEDLEYEFSFYYISAKNRLIRFKNQRKLVWNKRKV